MLKNGQIEQTKMVMDFIYARLINIHKENPNYDYMIGFRHALKIMEEYPEDEIWELKELLEEKRCKYRVMKAKLQAELKALKQEREAFRQRVTVEKIQTIIDIWIHDEGLGEYDKIPKIAEYDSLALALHKEIWKEGK